MKYLDAFTSAHNWKPVPHSLLFEEGGDGSGGGGDGSGAGAGDGKGTGATFDSAVFKTELMADLRKEINGSLKSMKTDFSKMVVDAIKAQAGSGSSNGGGTGSGGSGDGGGTGSGAGSGAGSGSGDGGAAGLNARLQQLEKVNRDLTEQVTSLTDETKAERNKRLEVERLGAVNEALNVVKFRDDGSREMFFRSWQSDVKRDEEGNYVVDTPRGPVTAVQFLKDKAESLPHLLAPKGDAGGSGGKPGSGKPGGGWIPTMDDLKPEAYAKLTPEQRSILGKTIAEQAGNVR